MKNGTSRRPGRRGGTRGCDGCVRVTHSGEWSRVFLWIGVLGDGVCSSRSPRRCRFPTNEEFRVDGEHPRLLLKAQKLRLLRRNGSVSRPLAAVRPSHSRQSPDAGTRFCCRALLPGHRRPHPWTQAVEWALGPGKDFRQLALVFDWCQVLLNETEEAALGDKHHPAVGSTRMPGTKDAKVCRGGPAPLPRLRWRTTARTCRPEILGGIVEQKAAKRPGVSAESRPAPARPLRSVCRAHEMFHAIPR